MPHVGDGKRATPFPVCRNAEACFPFSACRLLFVPMFFCNFASVCRMMLLQDEVCKTTFVAHGGRGGHRVVP